MLIHNSKISFDLEWDNDKCESGTILYTNNSKYVGKINDLYQKHDKEGKEFHPDGKKIKYHGEFKNDKFINGKANEEEVKVKVDQKE